METRVIELVDVNGISNKSVEYTGRESDKSTLFVLSYDDIEGEAFPTKWIESLNPDRAFCLSLSSATACKTAENNDLFALVERTQESIDGAITTSFVGWCRTSF